MTILNRGRRCRVLVLAAVTCLSGGLLWAQDDGDDVDDVDDVDDGIVDSGLEGKQFEYEAASPGGTLVIGQGQEPDTLYLLGHTQGANMGPYYGFRPEEIRPYVQMVEDRVFKAP